MTREDAIHIKLNEPIKVRLTDFGKQVHFHMWDDWNEIVGEDSEHRVEPSYPEEDENGYTTFLLCDFMQTYGRFVGTDSIPAPDVVESFEIIYGG